MNKAIFLDRDGTINVDKAYLSKIEDFEYLPGVIEGLRLLQDVGYKLIVITNQSGIARGYYTEKDFLKLNDWLLKDLAEKGIRIDKVYYCPHHPKANIMKYRIDCDCRKPKLGMYRRAVIDFDVDLSKSYVIGDKIRDVQLCKESECNGFIIDSDNEKLECFKIRRVSSLLEAAQRIIS